MYKIPYHESLARSPIMPSIQLRCIHSQDPADVLELNNSSSGLSSRAVCCVCWWCQPIWRLLRLRWCWTGGRASCLAGRRRAGFQLRPHVLVADQGRLAAPTACCCWATAGKGPWEATAKRPPPRAAKGAAPSAAAPGRGCVAGQREVSWGHLHLWHDRDDLVEEH